jgi:hypothetical protein
MNRLILIVMSALTLVLSACGTSEPPRAAENLPVEDEILEVNAIDIFEIKLELPGCTLPALHLDNLESFHIDQGCIFWGCIRYAAK